MNIITNVNNRIRTWTEFDGGGAVNGPVGNENDSSPALPRRQSSLLLLEDVEEIDKDDKLKEDSPLEGVVGVLEVELRSARCQSWGGFALESLKVLGSCSRETVIFADPKPRIL